MLRRAASASNLVADEFVVESGAVGSRSTSRSLSGVSKLSARAYSKAVEEVERVNSAPFVSIRIITTARQNSPVIIQYYTIIETFIKQNSPSSMNESD